MKFLGLVSRAGQLVLMTMGSIIVLAGVVLIAGIAYAPLLSGFAP